MTNLNETKAQVLDLLNQIAILTKDVPEGPTYENYNYQTVPVTSDVLNDYSDEELEDMGIDKTKFPSPEELDNSVMLRSIGDYVQRVLKSPMSAVHNETQYYNSNCY